MNKEALASLKKITHQTLTAKQARGIADRLRKYREAQCQAGAARGCQNAEATP